MCKKTLTLLYKVLNTQVRGNEVSRGRRLHPFVFMLTFCMMPDALKWRCASRDASLWPAALLILLLLLSNIEDLHPVSLWPGFVKMGF